MDYREVYISVSLYRRFHYTLFLEFGASSTKLDVYIAVKNHYESINNPPPLHMIVTGTAGTGKSYLIHCLQLLLKHDFKVAAPTGVASFIIDGKTLHTLLHLPTKGEFKQLEGNVYSSYKNSCQAQSTSSSMKYRWLGGTLLLLLLLLFLFLFLLHLLLLLSDHPAASSRAKVSTCRRARAP